MDSAAPPRWGCWEARVGFEHQVGAYLELMPNWSWRDAKGPLERGTGQVPTLWVFCRSEQAGMLGDCMGSVSSTPYMYGDSQGLFLLRVLPGDGDCHPCRPLNL